ncbi:hypothetical protein D8B26_004390 [Coccidioides posadasii str. Silveira]|uniref:uncharacterized protein n=1 Tax=Coccidioides posadasii (strain RMSCC 757 / Silveira) TaxID=443226 RepID=UPI001BEE0459|nr:hypothetical protein D8B26_004390 [Coccidioides posadasii str. Silveira]
MSCYGNKASFLQCSKALDSDDEIVNTSEKQQALFRRPYTPLPSRPVSSATSASIPDALRRSVFKKRPLSMSDSRFSLRFNSAEISRIFDFGRNTRNRAASIGGSGYGLLQQSSSNQAANNSSEIFRDDACYADGSAKPIMSFRGGTTWRHLDTEREQLSLDLFWSTRKENPFRPDIMPVEELAPLSNFRSLRSLKLTGMLRSYQRHIWQTVWLNPGLEDLYLEMALEPCIRHTFCGSWPKIRGKWFPRTAVTVRGLYYGKDGRGELKRRVGFGEYLDKHAIGNARETAAALGAVPDKLSVVKLTLMGFVVDSDPFFLWFNPHRLRSIDFKDHCVDAGFALPVRMSEHVIVSWPRDDNIPEAMWARQVRPGEIKLIDLGSRKTKATKNSDNKGGNKGKDTAPADDPCEGAAPKPTHNSSTLRKKSFNQLNDAETSSSTAPSTTRRVGALLNIGGRRFTRKKK